MSNNDCIKNSLAVATAACISILLIQDSGVVFYTGILGVSLLLIMALFSPWLGVLALFPLAFSLRPAPPSIGLQEISFAALLAVIFIVALVRLLRSFGISSIIRFFRVPLLIGLGVFSINLAVAMNNHVPLVDWARGAIPFLFIYALLPVCALVGDDESKIRWVGGSVATLIFLTAGYIVFYYFYHNIWQTYWIVTINGEEVRLSKEAALNNAEALGPMRDRITMLLAQATDTLLPVGMAAGFAVCTLARNRLGTIIGALMSLLCMSAVLITFTRSMLLSALAVIFLYSIFIFFFRKNLRVKLSATLAAVGTFGLAFILATGMQEIWLGRMSFLVESGAATLVDLVVTAPPAPEMLSSASEAPKKSADFNVSSRLEEYKIAWKMFLNHPALGNGLGVKHEMRWETTAGTSFTQFVAYIHSWPLYTLMVGGGLGFLIYSLVLFGPVFFRLTSLKSESTHWTVIRAVVLTMAIYGLFFAVFRLVSFNLLLAAVWGVIFAQGFAREINSRSGLGKVEHSDTLSSRTKEILVTHGSADQENMGLSV